MANLIGSVRFNSTIDGSRMPADAEKIGREAGMRGAREFGGAWDKEYRKSLTGLGRAYAADWEARGTLHGSRYGRGLENSFRKFSSRLSDAFDNFQGIQVDTSFLDAFDHGYEGVARLADEMKLLHDQGMINDGQFVESRKKIEDWANANRQAETNMARLNAIWKDASSEVGRYSTDLDDLDRKHRTLGQRLASLNRINPFKNLDNDVKLVIGLIASAADQIAVLGSAAGAGLIGLGGALTSAAVGAYGLGAVFVRLNEDIDKLPESMRPVAREFQAFKDAYRDLNTAVAGSAFEKMDGSFSRLSNTLSSLTPVLKPIGTEIGSIIDDLSRGLQPGTEAFDALSQVIKNARPNISSLADTTGKLGLAFLKAFGGAQPLVEQLLGWVDKLADRFLRFTSGPGLDQWVGNSMTVFSSLGELLDSVGRTLNNLVYPESIKRTTALLGNLSGFIPVLGQILDIIGRLDPLGNLALALNEIGEAISPLLPTLSQLATALGPALASTITGLASVLQVAAVAVTPFVQAIADIVSAAPPEVLSGVAIGIAAVAASMKLLGVAVAANNVTAATLGLTSLGGAAEKTAGIYGKLQGVIGKAAFWGAVTAGALGAAEAMEQAFRAGRKYDDQARNIVASNGTLARSMEVFGTSAFGMKYGLTNASEALDRLKGSGGGVNTLFGDIFNAFSTSGREAGALAVTLQNLDAPLAQMAQTNLPGAIAQFSAWAKELGATDAQALNMINQMEGFKSVLASVSGGVKGVATDQDILNTALGRGKGAAEGTAGALTGVGGAAETSRQKIETLADAIRGFGDETLSTRDANRQFEQSVADLSGRLTENGATLDLATQAGRDNSSALDSAIQKTNAFAASVYEQTGNQTEANKVLADGRQRLVDMLTQFDATGVAAGKYDDVLKSISPDVTTIVKLDGAADAEATLARISRQRTANVIVSISSDGSSVRFGNGNIASYASGGVLSTARYIRAGEAGPEAIVPLRRSLSQVDPSVRALSAFAQGKGTPSMANGGVVGAGSGKVLNIDPGAIVIQGADDPRRTALEVVDAIAEYATS